MNSKISDSKICTCDDEWLQHLLPTQGLEDEQLGKKEAQRQNKREEGRSCAAKGATCVNEAVEG